MDMVQKRGHMLAPSCSVSQLGVAETHNHKMVNELCDFALPFVIGITPSNVCQEFDTSLVR